MKFSKILNLPKNLLSKKEQVNYDKTIVMSKRAISEKTALPSYVTERYLVKRSLGKGAFGIVYLAEDRKIGRMVAIKQLFKSYLKNSEIRKRFMQEARIGAQLDHPNIINVFGLEEDEYSACIIMEYLGGGSLEAYMNKSKVVNPNTALQIFRGIMTGLDAAHKVMAIHRDIKPPNILFDHLGEPKISDFGVAYLPVNAGGSPEIESEKSPQIIGTPRYMSPEQISRGALDARTDLYSAGAVLYEMLTGKKIFEILESMTFSDICDIILHKKPTIPENNISEPIVNMVMKLLEKDCNDRYQTAESVLLEIDKISASTDNSTENSNKPRITSFGPLPNSPVEIFEDVIRLLLVDGVLAPSERRELNRRAESLGISNAQSRMIEEKVRAAQSLPSLKAIEEYRAMVEALFSSNSELKLKPGQKKLLKEKRIKLEIRKEESEILESQAKEKVRIEKRRK